MTKLLQYHQEDNAAACHHRPCPVLRPGSPCRAQSPRTASSRPWCAGAKSCSSRSTCTRARQAARRAMTLRSWQSAPSSSACTAASPANAKGSSGQSSRWSMAPSSERSAMPRPSSSVMTRSTPAKIEKGPLEAMCAMLTRQSKCSMSLPVGRQSTSRAERPASRA